jgi:hypothetical protein
MLSVMYAECHVCQVSCMLNAVAPFNINRYLHYSENRAKPVAFRVQKNFAAFLKHTNLARFSQ